MLEWTAEHWVLAFLTTVVVVELGYCLICLMLPLDDEDDEA